jgi:hypothetical protein
VPESTRQRPVQSRKSKRGLQILSRTGSGRYAEALRLGWHGDNAGRLRWPCQVDLAQCDGSIGTRKLLLLPGAGEALDGAEPALGAWPVLFDGVGARVADDGAQCDSNDDRVVGEAEDGDEVGNQVDG